MFDSKGERMNIYYIMPDGKMRLASRPAVERYLKDNLAVGLSTGNFCWQKVILGLNNPEKETVRTAKTRYSTTRSTRQMGTPPQLAFNDDSTPMANTKSIYHDRPKDLPSHHWAPSIKIENLDTGMQNPGMEHKAYNQGWQMPRYQISSDNTEEERETYTRQKTGTVETVEAQQLRALHKKNQKLAWSRTEKRNGRSSESIAINQDHNYALYAAQEQH